MKVVPVISAALTLGIAGTCSANIIFDQIGAVPPLDGVAFASQIFEPANAAFNIAALDDFTVSGGKGSITTVEAIMRGFGGFTSINNVTGWSVEIYSSVAAAGASLTGNAGSAFLTSATIVNLGGTFNFHITLDVTGLGLNLADGDYWIAVIPHLAFSGGGGQLGVSGSTIEDGPGAGPNAHQANPGGGFGFGPTTQILSGGAPQNLAYRITAVPAPGALALLGIAGLCGVRRRR
ncbi:MAG TPA: hypothetical protein PK098_10095 [Phycisphaerales bacterium]|nr:hypothetical protein [Phycisphaerales bacterium]